MTTEQIASTGPPNLRLVRGHRIGAIVAEFPHLCPGVGCAIGEWLRQQEQARAWRHASRD